MKEIKIKYRKIVFSLEIDEDDCWFNLDHQVIRFKDYQLIINADREVYATILKDDNKIEGYIVSLNDIKNSIPDNYPIGESLYQFKKHPHPGYYL